MTCKAPISSFALVMADYTIRYIDIKIQLMKRILYLSIFMLFTIAGYAQVENEASISKLTKPSELADDAFTIFLRKQVFVPENLHSDSLFNLLGKEAHLFFLAAVFDQNGRLEEMYISRKLGSSLLKLIESPSKFTSKIISLGYRDENYKGKVVLKPVMMIKAGGDFQSSPDFLLNFEGLWPELNEKDKSKPIVLHRPLVSIFFQPVR